MAIINRIDRKFRERILLLLLCICAVADTPVALAASSNDDSPVELSQDNLPVVPPQEESAPESVLIAAAGDLPRITDPAQAGDRIEELTTQILLKEIQLEKFNLNYKLNAAKQGRWKGWRYAFFNEANAGMGIAGGIIGTQQRGSHIHRSNKVKNYIQQNANYIPMIGSIIAASAAVLEFSINEYHEYEAFKKGFSPGKAKEYVNNLKNEISRMMYERDALVKLEESAPLLTERAEIENLEGKVLRDIRDQSLLEYQRFHLAARRLLAFQQCQYMFDFSKNTTNAIGLAFGYLALHRRRRPWNFKAGVLFDVSGALTMAGPIVSRLYAKSIHEYHKRYTKDTIQDAEARECAVLEADQKALDALCKLRRDGSPTSLARVDRGAIYVEHSKIFQDEVEKASKDLDKAKLVATQNIGASMYVGGSKLASGILFTIPGYLQLYNNGKTQDSSRVTNHLLFASGVVGLPASTFSLLDTLRIQVQGERNRHKLAAQGKLPAQLIKERLAQLDAMEARLKGNK